MERDELAGLLQAIAKARMPFGRFGPSHAPPHGIPIIDLPVEYLMWFEGKGFPSGKLGRMLEFVYRTKLEGADEIFDRFRRRNGGRASLHKRLDLHHAFDDEP